MRKLVWFFWSIWCIVWSGVLISCSMCTLLCRLDWPVGVVYSLGVQMCICNYWWTCFCQWFCNVRVVFDFMLRIDTQVNKPMGPRCFNDQIGRVQFHFRTSVTIWSTYIIDDNISHFRAIKWVREINLEGLRNLEWVYLVSARNRSWNLLFKNHSEQLLPVDTTTSRAFRQTH